MDLLVRKMKALGDRNRFRIVMMLSQRKICVCEILEVLDIAGGTLSNHLKILKNAGLIDQHKEGRWILYGLTDEKTLKFVKSLETEILDRSVIDADRNIIKKINRMSCSKSAKTADI